MEHERDLPTPNSEVDFAASIAPPAEEALVSDVRDGLTPAQMVERRLVSLLKTTPLPMSRLATPNVQRSRF